MSENANYIYQPPSLKSVELKAIPGKDGKTQYTALSIAQLTRGDTPLAQENNRRYQILKKDPAFGEPTCVDCYLSEEGWVVNLRNPENGEFTPQAVSRVMSEVKDHLASTTQMRNTDGESPWWKGSVRYLETEGLAVSAVTDDNLYGYFAAEIGEGNSLTGWGIEGKQPDYFNVTNTGVPISSSAPEAPKFLPPGLHYTHVHNMAVSHYDGEKWGNTFIVPSGKFMLQTANTTAIQYAQAAFEGGVAKSEFGDVDGLTARVNKSGNVTLFRVEENAKRMAKSVKAMGGPDIDPEQVRQSIIETVKQNLPYIEPGQNLYIRPYVMGTRGGAGANAAKEYIFAVEVWSFGDYFKPPSEGGIKLEGRLDLHRPSTGAEKVASNYSPLFREKRGAKKHGYNDLLSFDQEGNVEEVTSCAIFFVEQTPEGTLRLRTPAVSEDERDPLKKRSRNSLDSITRRSIIEMARALGIEVIKGDISHAEVPTMVGAFTVGSAAGITRVEQIDIKQTRDKKESMQTEFTNPEAIQMIQALYERLMEARTGTLTDSALARFNEWATKIPVKRGDLMPKKKK